MNIYKRLITLIVVFTSAVLIACSNESNETDNSKGSVIAKPQLDALKKAKTVENELLKRKEKLDEEIK